MSTAKVNDLRTDSYEQQLSDGELLWLHSSLGAGKETLEEIQTKAPPWRRGKYAGALPSITTLHNIRCRLMMEDELAEQEQTTDTLLAELAKDLPGLTDEDLDKIGIRHFSIRAMKRGDGKEFLKFRTALTDARIAAEKLRLAEQAEARKGQELELAKRRIQLLEGKLTKVSEAVGKAKTGGLTPEALKQIEEAAKIL